MGPDEINPEKGYISIDFLGKAVLGKEVGARVNIKSLKANRVIRSSKSNT